MMAKYEKVIFYSEKDERWICEVPELAGCMADGATPEEACKNADVIIEEWIETALRHNRVVPEPQGRVSFA